jgi:capsular polysaccharide biosynthesis protein/Mrp family chromosome partitioning ATPase
MAAGKDLSGRQPDMEEHEQHRTLRDYVAVLRRRKKLVAAIVAVGALAALGLSLIQDKTYTASATFKVQSQNQSVGLAGLLPGQGQLPAQDAAQAAQTATRVSVLRKTIEELGLKTSPQNLRSKITVTPNTQSNLVELAAEAPAAAAAARLANTVTSQAVDATNAGAQRQYGRLAQQLRKRAQDLGTPPSNLSSLTPKERAKLINEASERQVLSQQAAKMQALSTVAQLGQVVERATPPGSPSSPKTARNIVLGAVVGLFIGLGLAGVAESLDRRLRRPDDAKTLVEFPLVGVVPDDAMGGVPIAGTPAEDHVASMDAFRMLQTNLEFLQIDNPPRTVLVTSPLPQEGKTTVAIGVALASASSGRRTLLVEADLHRPVHSARLGLEGKLGLADYLSEKAAPREVVQVREFRDPGVDQRQNGAPDTQEAPHASLACITAGGETSWSAEMLASQRFGAFLDQVGRAYDFVVIDSAPLLAVSETSRILPLVDAVVFCVRLGRTTFEQARAGRDAILRLPERPVGLAITGLTGEAGDGYDYYSYAYSYRFGRAGVKA